MDFNINIRLNQLENFQQFIDDSKNNLQQILDDLGWSAANVQKGDALVKCTYNKTHLVAPKNVEAHHKTCSMRSLGYHKDDIQLSEPVISAKTSIIIDNETKTELFKKTKKSMTNFTAGWNGKDPDPKTSDRFISTFSPHERRALYDYTLSATKGPPVPPEFNINKSIDDNKELTYEERLELNRNLKRRRIKYKSVHTNHKNHTEVIREVINNQMDLYKECVIATKVKSEPPEEMNYSIEVKQEQEQEDVTSGYDESRSITSRQSDYSARSYKSYQRSRDNSYKGRSRDRDRSKDRHREKSWDIKRGQPKDKHGDSSRDFSRQRNRYRDEDRKKPRSTNSRSQSQRYHHKEIHKHRDNGRSGDRGSERENDRNKDRERHKDRSRKSDNDYYSKNKKSR